MHTDHINHTFLDPVLAGNEVDTYYHFGVASDDPLLEELRRVRAIILGGSGERARAFAEEWSRRNGGAPIVDFPKEDRFVTRYTAGVLFASHGMGMASASIALQELMRMVFFLKRGDLAEMARVAWMRVGTSGGVGLPPGTVVVSTEGLMADLKPYRLLQGGHGEYWFDGTFPRDMVEDLMAAAEAAGVPAMPGKTVAANDFFLEQFRLDGAISMETPDSKMAWLRWLDENGVRNIEMEGAMVAGYLNYWGFPRFGMICVTIVNRLVGDQVTFTPEELHGFTEREGELLFTFLRRELNR
ncbi:MAG: uridine phosphorylase [Actinomycetales bacterium]|nr:uridine phosphorylase [Actinomycetales bacterium]